MKYPGSGSVGGGITTGTTTTTGTTGSVLFADAGVVQEDNANFFWDNTNNQLEVNGAFSLSQPGYTFTGVSNALGITQSAANAIYFVYNGTTSIALNFGNSSVVIPSGYQYTFSSSDPSATGAGDVGIARVAPGVAKVTDGGAGRGFLQNAGMSRVTADITNATITPATVTGLSATLVSGRTYSGRMVLFVSNSLAADGLRFDFDGGTATATDFRAHGTLFDTALLLSSQTTALATDFTVATATGAGMAEFYFTITANVAGTFIPRFAGNTAVSGTVTLRRGSYMVLNDMP